MNTQCGKGLRRTLTEADVAETRLLCHVKDVVDGLWDVMPGKVVDAVVPELGRVGVMIYRLLGVLIPAVVT